MGTSPSLAPSTIIDLAVEALARGEYETAIRHAIPALVDDGLAVSAADVLGRALAPLGARDLAIQAHEHCITHAQQHGLIPIAVASALALRALDPKRDHLPDLAKHFSAEAKETAPPRPPAMPSSEYTPVSAQTRGPALLEVAKKALQSHPPKAHEIPRARLPLWSALPSNAFVRFAAALQVRIEPTGTVLLHQGETGQSAFILARGEVRVTRKNNSHFEEVAALGPGSIVGEMALITEEPRAATVTVSRAALILEVPRSALDEAAADVPAVGEQVLAFCRRRLVDNVLRTSALLREIPAEEREGLAQLFRTKTFEPGEALLLEGAPAVGLHLLAAGTVDVTRKEPSGEVLHVARVGAGSFLGEISLVLRQPATATAIAVTPTVSLHLPAVGFLELVRTRPTLFARLYELAVARQDQMVSVLGQTAEELEDGVLV